MAGRLGDSQGRLRDLERLGSKPARFDGDDNGASEFGRDGATIPALRPGSNQAAQREQDSYNSSLTEVSQRLQRLEQQVRLQLTNKTSASPPLGQGKSALRASLMALKDDVMSLAVSEVESQLLLQRLTALERAVARPSSTGAAWLSNDPGTTGPNMLAARLSGLEGALSELAAYQVTNSALLQQLGGRLSPEPAPVATGRQLGGGPGAYPPRASEPPLRAGTGATGIGAFAFSSPGSTQPPRGYSPGPYPYPAPHSQGMSTPTSDTAGGLFYEAQPPAAAGRVSTAYAGARASPEPVGYMSSGVRQLELIVNAHEGELAGLRTAVGRLDAERRLAAAATGQVAEEVSNLAARVLVVERGVDRVATAAAAGGDLGETAMADTEALQGLSQALEEVTSRLAAVEDRTADLPRQELSATGLATSANSAANPELVAASVASLQLQVQQLGADMLEVSSKCQAAQQSASATAGEMASSKSAVGETLQGMQERLQVLEQKQVVTNPLFGAASNDAEMLEQLLNSAALQQLISAKVEAALAEKLELAVAARVEQARPAEPAGEPAQVAALQATVADLSAKLQALEQAQEQAGESAGLEKSLSTLQDHVSALANVEELAAQVATQQVTLLQQASRLEVMDAQLQQLAEQRDTTGLVAGAAAIPHRTSSTSSAAAEEESADQLQSLQLGLQEVRRQLSQQEAVTYAAAAASKSLGEAVEQLKKAAAPVLQQVPQLQATVKQQEDKLRLVAVAMERQKVLEEGSKALTDRMLGVQRDTEASHHLVQQQIEQLSQQLVGVNEHALDEDDLKEVKQQLEKVEVKIEALQQTAAQAEDLGQLGEQVGSLSRHVADVVALIKEVPGLKQQVEGLVQAQEGLAAAQEVSALQKQAADTLAQLQQVSSAVEQLQAERKEQQQLLQAQGQELSQQVASSVQQLQQQLEAAAAARASIQEQLVKQVEATGVSLQQLKEWVEQRDSGLQEHLRQQVETMAQILADSGAAKAEQAAAQAALRDQLQELEAKHAAAAADFNAAQTALAKHLQETLTEAQHSLQQQLTGASGVVATVEQLLANQAAVCRQVSELEEVVGSCATAAAVGAVSNTLRGLGSKVEQLGGIMEQLGAAQRATDGQLANEQEQLADQRSRVAKLQQEVSALPTAAKLQKLWGEMTELLEPLQQEVAQLGSQLDAVKEQHTSDIVSVKSDLLTVLEGQQGQLAIAIDELQAVVTERCVKTEQLARIFAARDDMYESWSKMQAVFDTQAKSAAQVLFRVRPTMSPAPSTYDSSMPVTATSAGKQVVSIAAAEPAAAAPAASTEAAPATEAAAAPAAPAAASRHCSRANSSAAQQLPRAVSLASAASAGPAEGAAVPHNFEGPSEGGFSAASSSSYITALSQHPGSDASVQLAQLSAAVHQLQEGLAAVQQQLAANTPAPAVAATAAAVESGSATEADSGAAGAAAEAEGSWIAPDPTEVTATQKGPDSEISEQPTTAATAEVEVCAPVAGVAVSTSGVEGISQAVQQLQEELAAVKDALVRKEQFAALALTLRDLRDSLSANSEATATALEQQQAQLNSMAEKITTQAAEMQQAAAVFKEADPELAANPEQLSRHSVQEEQLQQLSLQLSELSALPADVSELRAALSALQATVDCGSTGAAADKHQQEAQIQATAQEVSLLKSNVQDHDSALQQLRGQLEAVAASLEDVAAAATAQQLHEEQQATSSGSTDLVASAVMEVKTALLTKLAEAEGRLAALESASSGSTTVRKTGGKKPAAIPHAPASSSKSGKGGKASRRASGSASADVPAEGSALIATPVAAEQPVAVVEPAAAAAASRASLADVSAAVDAVTAKVDELAAAQASLQQEQARMVEAQSKANLRAMASKAYGLAFSQGTGDLEELWDVVNRLTATVEVLETERGQQLGVLTAIREEVAATAAAAAAATATAGTKTPQRSPSPAGPGGAEEEGAEESMLAEDVSVLSLQLRALTASVESLQQQQQRAGAAEGAAAGPVAAESVEAAEEEPVASRRVTADVAQRLQALEEVQSEVSQLKEATQKLTQQLTQWVGKAAETGEVVAHLQLVSTHLTCQLESVQQQVATTAQANDGGSANSSVALQQAQEAQQEQIRDLLAQVNVLEGLVRHSSPLVNVADDLEQLQGEHRDLASVVARVQQQQQAAVAAMGASLHQIQEQQGSLAQGLGALRLQQEELQARVIGTPSLAGMLSNDMAPAAAPAPVSVTAGPVELSFDDLAEAPSPTARAMAQQTTTTVEVTTAAPERSGSAAAGAANSSSGSSSVEVLVAQLGCMTPAQQVTFLAKLLQVVESHAAGLARQYASQPELAEQLQQVDDRLNELKQQLPAGSAYRQSSSSTRSYARTSSNAGVVGPGVAGGEVLLSILDQVASLRAIGSQTHPALVATIQCQQASLEKLAEQLCELREHVGITSEQDLSVSPALASSSSTAPEAAAAASTIVRSSSSVSSDPELVAKVAALEGQVAGAWKLLNSLRSQLLPLQEYLDSSQSMMRELQVVHGDVVRRVETLEAAEAAAADAGLSLAASNTLRKIQEDMAGLGRRLAAAEAGATNASEALSSLRRLSAKLADSDARSAASAARLASIAATLPVLTGQVAATEQRVGGKLAAAFKVLDNLADQLASLGNMPRPPQKSQALAALDPHYKNMQALDAKMEAVRTALTASTRLLLSELSSDAAASAVRGGAAAASLATSELETAAKEAAAAAGEAASGEAGSHQEALKALEARLNDVSNELSMRIAFTAGELDDKLQAQGTQLSAVTARLAATAQ